MALVAGVIVCLCIGSLFFIGLKRLIPDLRVADEQFYTFIIGKMNEPKLANFGEIDMFVFIGCSRHSIIDSKKFMKDIITPYELTLALNEYVTRDSF